MDGLRITIKGANFSANSLGKTTPVGFDDEVNTYLNAQGITDVVQRSSLNTFVIGLKDNGLYYKMAFLHPFSGNTLANFSKSLIGNVTDITSWFSATAGTGKINTSLLTAKIPTGFLMSSTMGNGDFHIASYVKNNNSASWGVPSGFGETVDDSHSFTVSKSGGSLRHAAYTIGNTANGAVPATSNGFVGMSILADATVIDRRGGFNYLRTGTVRTPSVNALSAQFTIGSASNAFTTTVFRGDIACVCVGTRLTATEISTLDTLMSAFATNKGV